MKYRVEFTDRAAADVEAEDCQITAQAVKFLNGKGKGAQIVAYFPAHRVIAVEEVK